MIRLFVQEIVKDKTVGNTNALYISGFYQGTPPVIHGFSSHITVMS